MSLYPCRYELERWGEFQVRAFDGLGYPASSPLYWAMKGRGRVRWVHGKLPIGMSTRGLGEYLLVERALSGLGPKHKIVAFAEHAAPLTVVGKSMTKRALTVGMSLAEYRRRLIRIHDEICKIFEIQERV